MIIHVMFWAIDDVIKSLENDYINVFKWFLDNQMKANSNKRCRLKRLRAEPPPVS